MVRHQSIPSNAAAVFRAIAHGRTTCRRFQPNQTIPRETMKDILESTIVRCHIAVADHLIGVAATKTLLCIQMTSLFLHFHVCMCFESNFSLSLTLFQRWLIEITLQLQLATNADCHGPRSKSVGTTGK